MPRAAPLLLPLLLLLLALAQRRACLPGPATVAPLGRDPCLSQPCRNNGTCSPVPARGPAAPRRLQLLLPQRPAAYSCACPAGVTGTSCQVRGAPASAPPSRPASLRPSLPLGVPARSAAGSLPSSVRLTPPRLRASLPALPRSAPSRSGASLPARSPREARSGGRCPFPRRAAACVVPPPPPLPVRAAAPSRRLLARQPLVPLTGSQGCARRPRLPPGLSEGLAALHAAGRAKRVPVLRGTGLEPRRGLAAEPRGEPSPPGLKRTDGV